jgi:SDR family mycofactocin-dependent oxidoreductase
MGRVENKVAFITGAARGQGRAHAIRLAEEGADIIAVDICDQIETVAYPLATLDDLAETVRLVERCDRRVVARPSDVRDRAALQAAFDAGVAELGGVDIVVANAGIAAVGQEAELDQAFHDVLAVNLTGVWNTVRVSTPALIDQGRGGAIILISSTAGLKGVGGSSPGGEAYTASKHGVVGLMRNLATNLAKHRIRVNTVHPTGVRTPMVENAATLQWLEEQADLAGILSNLLPIDVLEPSEISSAVLWLASDEARYVTGVTLPVDAGFTVK